MKQFGIFVGSSLLLGAPGPRQGVNLSALFSSSVEKSEAVLIKERTQARETTARVKKKRKVFILHSYPLLSMRFLFLHSR